MKLEVIEKNEPHKEMVTAVAWAAGGELLACSDDKTISRWSGEGEFLGKLPLQPLNTYVTDLSVFPVMGAGASGKNNPGPGSANDLLALGCTDGTYRLITRGGREEKKVEAHMGATTRVRWNLDGTALLTAGEEGDIKVWSRNGNLRSTLAQTGKPVYALGWGPDNDQVVASKDKDLLIKNVNQAGKKGLQWKAHDGLVMTVDWNMVNQLIVSGGEDCTYKVWDAYGRQLYSSQPFEHVITSVAWRPNGENFAVGAYNMLRLCDRTGWSYSRERPQCGSVLQISWSPDGTQLAGAGGTGAVVLAQIVKRQLSWHGVEATLVEPRKIRVQDVNHETYEELEFRDRVVEMALGYGNLVVATATQCHIYSVNNLNTPHIFDLRGGSVGTAISLILLAERHFLLVDGGANGIQIFNYEGRLLSNPRFQGLRPESLSRDTISLAADCVAIIDHTEGKCVRTFDVLTGKQVSGNVTHGTEIVAIALSLHGLGLQERRLAFIDKNRELYIMPVTPIPGYTQTNAAKFKLHTQVDSIKWSDKSDVLAALADGRMLVWYYPNVVYVDRELLSATRLSQDANELGKLPQILTFLGPRLTVRRVDGAIMTQSIPVHPLLLYELVQGGRWEEAVKLCRFVKNDQLWACLAAMAINGKSLETAEIALAALSYVDKLEYMLYLRSIPSEPGRNAELALYRRCPEEAERILLQANPPLLYRAIKMNIRLFRWGRALELAVNQRSHVDTVLAYRQRYLESMGREENDPRFLQYSQQVKIDWDTINAKKAKEREEERSRGGHGRGK